MAKFRNISGEALWVDLGNGAMPKVEPGEVIDFPASDRYIQTGETGEIPLWEAVAPANPTKKSAPAEKE